MDIGGERLGGHRMVMGEGAGVVGARGRGVKMVFIHDPEEAQVGSTG